MRELGRGLATCGIWLGVGLIGWNEPVAGVVASMLGTAATCLVWCSKSS